MDSPHILQREPNDPDDPKDLGGHTNEPGNQPFLHDGTIVIDPGGRIVFWNSGAAQMFRHACEEVYGLVLDGLLCPQDPQQIEAARREALDAGHWEGELITSTKDGTPLIVSSRWQTEYDAQGRPGRILTTHTDIRLWDRILGSSLRQQRHGFESLFGQYADGVAALDPQGRLIAANAALTQLTGYEREELLSVTLSRLVADDDLRSLHAALREAGSGKPQSQEWTCVRKEGGSFDAGVTLLPNMLANRIIGINLFVKDISERKRSERHVLYLANHDALTGLPNRNLLQDRLQHALEQAHRLGSQVAVLFMDLNRFKAINDSLGHDKGDLLLRIVARRLKGTLRDGDTVARLGGDEFVVVLENIHGFQHVRQVADALIEQVCRPLDLDGHALSISTSIGASLYPRDGIDPDTLLKNADLAMYAAKESGSGSGAFRFYETGMNDRALARLNLEQELRRAIDAGELVVHYQPRLDVSRNEIAAVEALVRWEHPRKGLVYPSSFIVMAEETGIIDALGTWVLRTACVQVAQWRNAGLSPIRLSVNVSARQLQSQWFSQEVEQILVSSGFDPHYLELEVTESGLMQNVDAAQAVRDTLRRLGISLSIDDFGTGYSSLSDLKRLPVRTLKIDKSFVRNLAGSEDDKAIVGAAIAMAHSMQLRVVAEGVTSFEQMRWLETCGCDEVQGYLLCQPLPASELESFLKTCSLRGIYYSWTQ